jgi:site-specific DNA-methyltransferase (adenine-specific)
MEPESVDAVVTDPPYEFGFMGKAWDAAGVAYDPATWAAVIRVLKPGGHLLAFGGSRTYHRMACAVEDAGFEIRDQIMWLYGSGFPKSHNLDGDRQGWGTALKPAHEPIVVARKPLIGTVAANVERYGTGAINVDGCRISTDDKTRRDSTGGFGAAFSDDNWRPPKRVVSAGHASGRWPANVVLDEEAGRMLDEQSGDLPPGVVGGKLKNTDLASREWGSYGDCGGASRFFYCAKASRKERERGLEELEYRPGPSEDYGTKKQHPLKPPGEPNVVRPLRNHHPTVKPVALMRWLVRLVTPLGGLVLDPFAGSGTTGIACALEGFRFVGIEQDEEYAEIAEKRIAATPLSLFGTAPNQSEDRGTPDA